MTVYFAEISNGPIKIGWTNKSPALRLCELQTGCPWKIRLIGYLSGDVSHERLLHRMFDSSRMAGEWFSRSPELEAEIAKVLSVEFRWPEIGSTETARIIDRFGGPAAFGRAIGVAGFHAQAMKTRDSIPPGYWLRVVEAAKKLGIEDISLDRLVATATSRIAEVAA